MGKVASLVGKMPFAGKSTVENAALNAVCERTSMQEKVAKAGRAATFLAIFAVMHGFQGKLGISELQHDIHGLQNGVSPLDVLETANASLYTLANAAVVYTQFELSGRVLRNFWHFRQAHLHGEAYAHEDYQFEPRIPTGAQVAFTSAGQALFLAQFSAHH